MIPLLLFLISLPIAVGIALVIVDYLTGPPLKREVIVHTRRPDDQSIRGILTRRSRRWVRLEMPRYVDGEAGTLIPLEGDVAIPAADIAFIQVL